MLRKNSFQFIKQRHDLLCIADAKWKFSVVVLHAGENKGTKEKEGRTEIQWA
jgi:hypothetical protein